MLNINNKMKYYPTRKKVEAVRKHGEIVYYKSGYGYYIIKRKIIS